MVSAKRTLMQVAAEDRDARDVIKFPCVSGVRLGGHKLTLGDEQVEEVLLDLARDGRHGHPGPGSRDVLVRTSDLHKLANSRIVA